MNDEEICLICGGPILVEDETAFSQRGLVHKRCLQGESSNENEKQVLDDKDRS
jgi:hypothetical protein